jgi:hypothetical protein
MTKVLIWFGSFPLECYKQLDVETTNEWMLPQQIYGPEMVLLINLNNICMLL